MYTYVESGFFDNTRAKRLIDTADDVVRQRLENQRGRNGVHQQLVQASTHLQEPCRGLLTDDHVGCALTIHLPVWLRNGHRPRQIGRLHT